MTAPPAAPESAPARVVSVPVLGALAIGAIAIRGAYIAAYLRHYRPQSDASQYHQLAISVAHGHGLASTFPFWYVHPTAFRPPLYPVVLGALYRVTGDSLLSAMLFNVVLGALVVVLAAEVATRIGGPTAGIAAGVFVAIMPSLIANDVVPLAESLSLVLLLGALLALMRDHDVVAAITVGLLMLARPSAQAFALLVAMWMVRRVGWWRAVRFLLIVGLVVVPWVARNWIEVGTPQLVTSNGFNLAAMYSTEAQQRRQFVDPFLDPAFATTRRTHPTEASLDAALRSSTLAWLRHHPSLVPALMRRNARFFFELEPGGNRSAEVLDGRNLGFRGATLPVFFLIAGFGIVGLASAWRRPGAILVGLTGAYFATASLVTVAAPRLRAPFDVACCIGAGLLVAMVLGARDHARVGPVRQARGPMVRQIAMLGAAIVLLAATTLVLHARQQRDARAAMRSAVERDLPAVQRLAGAYPIDVTARTLPSTAGALARVDRLDARLFALAPQLSTSARPPALAAGDALRRARDDFTTLALFEIADPRRASAHFTLADLALRYTRERGTNSSLPTWSELTRGSAALEAARRVEGLARR
ncbi:MAG: Dolichyl-phosphate-mannose-protein mannosyltransferase [Actinomycetia bacterium]|nr:Dolichyl-phosphate-mannose-protein mannosyltransferase [Actinomycetes bacterium]